MALEQRDVERLANEARSIVSLAAQVCNPAVLVNEVLALEHLRILDAALANARKLTQDIIKSAKE